ncbi:MAG: amidohydrolase, partial [Clostridiales bacterium]|nr:amidohydrolase [Clostridiales bacterium]
MLIFNANVHPMDKKVIENGFVRLEGGKVSALGTMEDCPPVAPGDVDAQGGQLYPGWVDAHCHLGLLADGQTYDQDDCREERGAGPPRV